MEKELCEKNETRYDIFIEEWRFQLELQKKLFDTLDGKTQWLFTVVAGSLGYFITTELYKIIPNFNICLSSHFLFLVDIIFGFIILWISVHILNPKQFHTWPHIWKQKDSLSPDKASIAELKSHSTSAYIESYKQNYSIIENKGRLFRISVYLTYVYFIFITIYFLISIPSMSENKDWVPEKTDIWVQPNAITKTFSEDENPKK